MVDDQSFIDTHCHLLPGVDDGASTWEESLAMARLAVADGIATTIVTPHQLGVNRQLAGPAIRAKTAHLQEYLNRNRVPLAVLPGAEVHVEPEVIEAIREGEVLTLADRGRYVLLELPYEVYLPLDDLLRSLRRAGLVGILAHAERNLGLMSQPELIAQLLEASCLVQVTAGSIVGSFGPEVQRLAERVIERGEAHFVATDAHGSKSRRPQMRQAFQRTVELAGYKTACALFHDNPAAILEDRPVKSSHDRPPGKRHGLGRWFRWSRAG